MSGWRRWLLFVSWGAALVLLLVRIDVGALLFTPGLVWFGWMVWRSPRLRERALDGLERRTAELTSDERDKELEIILRLYGGRPEFKVQLRVQGIRELPTRDSNAHRRG